MPSPVRMYARTRRRTNNPKHNAPGSIKHIVAFMQSSFIHIWFQRTVALIFALYKYSYLLTFADN